METKVVYNVQGDPYTYGVTIKVYPNDCKLKLVKEEIAKTHPGNFIYLVHSHYEKHLVKERIEDEHKITTNDDGIAFLWLKPLEPNKLDRECCFNFQWENSAKHEFLKTSLEIVKLWLNPKWFSVIMTHFGVNDMNITTNTESLKIEYEDDMLRSRVACTNREVGFKNKSIKISGRFKRRLVTLYESKKMLVFSKKEMDSFQEEIETIIIFQAVLIMHELGHLFLRWRGINESHEQFEGEAGDFLESRLFGHKVFSLYDAESIKFLGLVMDIRGEYRMIKSDYIKQIFELVTKKQPLRGYDVLPMVCNLDSTLPADSFVSRKSKISDESNLTPKLPKTIPPNAILRSISNRSVKIENETD